MTSEKKVLILDATGKDWTDCHLQGPSVDVSSVYRLMPLPLRVLRRIFSMAISRENPYGTAVGKNN